MPAQCMELEDGVVYLAKTLQQLLLTGSLLLVHRAGADGHCRATAVWAPWWWQQDQEGLNPSINLGGEVCCV